MMLVTSSGLQISDVCRLNPERNPTIDIFYTHHKPCLCLGGFTHIWDHFA